MKTDDVKVSIIPVAFKHFIYFVIVSSSKLESLNAWKMPHDVSWDGHDPMAGLGSSLEKDHLGASDGLQCPSFSLLLPAILPFCVPSPRSRISTYFSPPPYIYNL